MKEVVLKNKDEFIKVLKQYEVSPHASKILHSVEYVVLVGPAAGGRNTIISGLVATGKYRQIISDTTRPPKLRDGKMEQHGVNYFFRKEEELLQDLRDGEFLEAELIHNQQVSGTSIRVLEEARDEGLIAINEIEFGGARNVLAAKPDTKVFAILPPSYEEWIDRFTSREEISKTELKNRVQTAKHVVELIQSEPRVQVIINDDHRKAVKVLDAHVHGAEDTPEQAHDIDDIVADYAAKIDQALLDLA